MPVGKETCSAIVSSTDDPKQLGRIRVKCETLTGDPDVELPRFIEPCLDWGMFFIPDVGEEIEIEYIVSGDQDEGVPYQAFIEEPRYKWRGKRFRSDGGEAPRPIDELFKQNYGKRRGFVSPGGHILLFDDTIGSEQVTLAWKRKADGKVANISFDKNGSVTLSNQNGATLFLDAPSQTATLFGEDQNILSLSPGETKLIDKFGNVISMSDGLITILGSGDMLVSTASNISLLPGATANIRAMEKVNVEGPQINIGAAADSAMVRGDDLNTYLTSKLTVSTAFGPSGPSTVPLSTELSVISKVK